MPERTDADELRALERKAYGRDGVLTVAESQRLRELEDARHALSRVGDAPPDVVEPPETADPPDAPETPDAVGPPDPLEAPTTLRAALRRNAMALIAACAVLLAIGVGAGWALFAPRPASVPLTDEQHQRRVELSAGDFDQGSIRAVAKNDDALAWFATRDDGDVICLILDAGDQTQTDCLPADESGFGLSVSLSPTSAEAEDESGSAGENVSATLFLTEQGEPMVGIQRWGAGLLRMEQFPQSDRDRAGALVAEGYGFGLSIVARFRGAAVWAADRVSEQGDRQRCLIVDSGGGAVACKAQDTAMREGLLVHVVDVDPTGGVIGVSVLDLLFTGQQTPYLTVTEAESLSEVAPGESFVVQGPQGDPIEVYAPGTGTGG